MLELARKLFESKAPGPPEDAARGLATTLLRLGDLQKLNGHMAAAILDYERCLTLRKAVLDPTDRDIADAEWCLAVAFEYQAAETGCDDPAALRARALQHYRNCTAALEGLFARATGAGADVEEIKGILGELRETIADCEVRLRDGDGKDQAHKDKAPAAAATATTTIGFAAPAASANAADVATLQPKKKQKREPEPTPLARADGNRK